MDRSLDGGGLGWAGERLLPYPNEGVIMEAGV